MTMTVQEVREALSQKITSKDQFNELLVKMHPSNLIARPEIKVSENGMIVLKQARMGYVSPGLYYPSVDDSPLLAAPATYGFGILPRITELDHTRWWLLREWLRMRYGVYTLTEPLVTMFNGGGAQWAVHCAVGGDDPTMIAYTPDPQSGEQDRQRRTTLSKFLRSVFPIYPDNLLRDVEALHRGDLNNEVEFITGPAIADAYENCSLSSCMTHSTSRFKTPVHPTLTYDAPGFALAVLRGSDGNISARCMTWVDPDNPSDKRYVRVFGDGALLRRLTRLGYLNAGFAGARLRRIEVNIDGVPAFLVPYLDGAASGQRNASRAIFDGDYLLLLDAVGPIDYKHLQRVASRTGKSTVSASSSGGVVHYDPKVVLTMADLDIKCPVSGVSLLGEELVYMLHEGEVKMVHPVAVPAGWVERYAYFESRSVTVFAPEDASTFEHGSTYLDTGPTRLALGYVRLSEVYYPDRPWVMKSTTVFIHNSDSDSDEVKLAILKSDCAQVVVNVDGLGLRCRSVHRSTINTRTHTPITRISSAYPLYAPKGADYVVRTVTSGRKVVPGVHDVVKCYDGRYDYERNLRPIQSPLGYSTFAPHGAMPSEQDMLDFDKHMLRECVKDKSIDNLNSRAWRERWFFSVYGYDNQLPMLIDGAVIYVNYMNSRYFSSSDSSSGDRYDALMRVRAAIAEGRIEEAAFLSFVYGTTKTLASNRDSALPPMQMARVITELAYWFIDCAMGDVEAQPTTETFIVAGATPDTSDVAEFTTAA